MADLTERIQLTIEHRDLILKYGYVSGRLEASLRAVAQGPSDPPCGDDRGGTAPADRRPELLLQPRRSRSDSDAVWELCEHLEYAQRTGDGDLDILW